MTIELEKLFVFERRAYSQLLPTTPFRWGSTSRSVSTNGKAPLEPARKEHPTLRINTLSAAFATGLLALIRSPVKHRCETRR